MHNHCQVPKSVVEQIKTQIKLNNRYDYSKKATYNNFVNNLEFPSDTEILAIMIPKMNLMNILKKEKLTEKEFKGLFAHYGKKRLAALNLDESKKPNDVQSILSTCTYNIQKDYFTEEDSKKGKLVFFKVPVDFANSIHQSNDIVDGENAYFNHSYEFGKRIPNSTDMVIDLTK